MTVAEVNALLYSSRHPRDQLERALRIPALSPGWRWSFEALLREPGCAPRRDGQRRSRAGRGRADGGAGISAAASLADRSGMRRRDLVVAASRRTEGGSRLPLPGQFVVLRLRPKPRRSSALPQLFTLRAPLRRALSRQRQGGAERRRQERYLSSHVRAGDILDVSEPRGSFTLQPGDGPVVLLSAGIGATPVLAMLHALAASASPREVWWLHGARNGKSHSFAAEVRQLLGQLARGRRHIWYSQPDPDDREGQDYDATGRLG